jgi:hypothetical protein
MTVHLTLPKDLEQRLLAEVQAGRQPSLEAAILQRLNRRDEVDVVVASGMTAEELRRDLNDACDNRQGAVDGENVFARIASKSASLRSQGK